MAELGSTEPYEASEDDVIPEPLVPKLTLGQLAFYLMNNKVHSANIVSIKVVMNLHDDWCSNSEQQKAWQFFGESNITYRTVHGTMLENQIFASKEELLESM